jgi:hypothetical protein
MFDSFRPVLKVESSILEERGSFTVKGLTKTFGRAIHRRRVDFCKFKVDTILKQIVLEFL